MAIIRSGSNPEQLYIWETTKEGGWITTISWGCDYGPPLASSRLGIFEVPSKDFYALVRAWVKCAGDETFRQGNLSVQEVYVSRKTGVPYRDKKTSKAGDDPAFMIRLGYRAPHKKGQFIFMWRVTWDYIVNDVLSRGDVLSTMLKAGPK